MQTKHLSMLTLALIALVLMGCGGGGAEVLDIDAIATGTAAALNGENAGGEANGTPAPSGESGEMETPPPEGSGQPYTFSGFDLAGFDTYHMNMIMDVSDAGNSLGSLNIDVKVDRQTQAAYQALSLDGAMDMGMGEIVTVYKDDVTYVYNNLAGCQASQGDTDGMLTEGGVFTTQSMLPTETAEMTHVGPAGQINGVPAVQYHVDLQEEGLEEASMDIWVAEEGDRIVRLVMTGRGPLDEVIDTGDEIPDSEIPEVGTITVEFNLLSANQPVEITLPTECEGVQPGAPPAG